MHMHWRKHLFPFRKLIIVFRRGSDRQSEPSTWLWPSDPDDVITVGQLVTGPCSRSPAAIKGRPGTSPDRSADGAASSHSSADRLSSMADERRSAEPDLGNLDGTDGAVYRGRGGVDDGAGADEVGGGGEGHFAGFGPVAGGCVAAGGDDGGDGADGSGDVGGDLGDLGNGAEDLLPVGPAAVEVGAVDRVGVAVVVGGGRAAGFGVDLEEPAEVGGVEADAHEDDAAECLAGALFATQPAVAGGGLSADGVGELVGVVERRRAQGGVGGRGQVGVGSGDHSGQGAGGGVLDDPPWAVGVVAVVVEPAGGGGPTGAVVAGGGEGARPVGRVEGPVLPGGAEDLPGDQVVGVEAVGQPAGQGGDAPVRVVDVAGVGDAVGGVVAMVVLRIWAAGGGGAGAVAGGVVGLARGAVGAVVVAVGPGDAAGRGR